MNTAQMLPDFQAKGQKLRAAIEKEQENNKNGTVDVEQLTPPETVLGPESSRILTEMNAVLKGVKEEMASCAV